jgi:ketoreductase
VLEPLGRKVAVVTGGGSGIGAAVVARFEREGATCHALARRGPVKVDVTDKAAVRAFFATLERIDILVCAAGTNIPERRLEQLTETGWREIVETNLNGVYFTTKAVLNEGGMTKGGRIVSVASTGGKQGVIYAAAYSASKHGVVGFTKSLALELASKGITVNSVCPGFVETDLAVRAREGYARIWEVTPEEAKRRIEQRVPIGRYIEPDEVADMVAYLVSPKARGITGQTVNVCGGLGNY